MTPHNPPGNPNTAGDPQALLENTDIPRGLPNP